MKRTIRRGVFETNSSSVHAISISEAGNLTYPKFVYFETGKFGWEHEIYHDKQNKAAYLWTGILENYLVSEVETIQDKITQMLSEEGVECEFTDCKKMCEYKGEVYYSPYGYIDHACELKEWLDEVLNDKSKLLAFLFDSDSAVETWNDNTMDDSDFNYQVPNGWTYYKGN